MIIAWLVGVGAGMALMFVGAGLLAALAGYLFTAVRNAKDILPDHDVAVTTDSLAS